MFPLAKREIGGYKFSQRTWYSLHHLGVDYRATVGTQLKAPFNGVIVDVLEGFQGGKTIWFKPDHDNVIMRFMHLSQFRVSKGQRVNEGDLIGLTGNTGYLSTAAHLHLDISRGNVVIGWPGNFIDPESYNWVSEVKPEPKPEPQTYTVRLNFKSNFRKSPSLKSPIFATYPAGTVVSMEGKAEGDVYQGSNLWLRSKKSGVFIHSSLVTIL